MDQESQQELMQLQQQLQTVVMQKEELKTKRDDLGAALDEMEDVDTDEDLYKSVGMLLIRRDRDELEEEFADEKERLDMKIQSLEKKEEQLTEQLQEAAGGMGGQLGGLGAG